MPNGAMCVPSCPSPSACASSESPSRADTPFIACRKASRSSPLDAARAISAGSKTEQQALGCYCSNSRGCPSCRRRVGSCHSPSSERTQPRSGRTPGTITCPQRILTMAKHSDRQGKACRHPRWRGRRLRALRRRKQRRPHHRRDRRRQKDQVRLSPPPEWSVRPSECRLLVAWNRTMLIGRGIRAWAGLVNPNCTAFIGNGVVVHIPAFFEELDNLTKKGE